MTREQFKIREYQRQAVAYIVERQCCGVFLNIGYGKTASVILAAMTWFKSHRIKHALVIAPKHAVQNTWPNELNKWDVFEDVTYTCVVGTVKERLAALRARPQLTIINRDNVKWLIDVMIRQMKKKRCGFPFDALIIDESTSFKNSKTQRFKAIKKLSNFLEYKVILTGTPSPQSLMDLWAQIYIVDNGVRLGTKFTEFRARYFYQPNHEGYKWCPQPFAQKQITEAIKDIVLSIDPKEAGIEIIEPVKIRRSIDLPDHLKQKYRLLEKKFFLELDSGDKIHLPRAAALQNKLQQFSNGAVYDNPENPKDKTWHQIHDYKLQELESIINENANEPILVGYMYEHDVVRMEHWFPQGQRLNNPSSINDFEEGRLILGFGHPASIAHALNFQYACALVVWFGLPWSLELYEQFNGRVARSGQTRGVRIIHLVGRSTIDDRMVSALKDRAKTQDEVIAVMRRHYHEGRAFA